MNSFLYFGRLLLASLALLLMLLVLLPLYCLGFRINCSINDKTVKSKSKIQELENPEKNAIENKSETEKSQLALTHTFKNKK